MKILLITFSLLFSLNLLARPAGAMNYEAHLARLVEEGHLNQSDAQEQIIQNELTVTDQNKRKSQARGIASTLSKVKVYKFVNEPIEIQP